MKYLFENTINSRIINFSSYWNSMLEIYGWECDSSNKFFSDLVNEILLGKQIEFTAYSWSSKDRSHQSMYSNYKELRKGKVLDIIVPISYDTDMPKIMIDTDNLKTPFNDQKHEGYYVLEKSFDVKVEDSKIGKIEQNFLDDVDAHKFGI